MGSILPSLAHSQPQNHLTMMSVNLSAVNLFALIYAGPADRELKLKHMLDVI